MTLLDVSQQIFGNKGNSYSPAQIAATETNGADVLYGTAQIDADSGEVEVLIDGTEIPVDPDDPDYGLASTMTCETEELIQAGDRVTVVRNGQNAKAIVLSPDSTGAAAAQQAADEAKAIAEATGQHFWHRSTDPNGDGAGTGAFVTDEAQDDFLTAAASGFADYDPSTKPYRNVLMNSLGFLIREALHNLASFTQSAVSFFDGNGDQTATFGTNGAVIGRVANSESRTEISGDGMQVYRRDNGSDTMLASIGYGYGQDYPGGPSVQVPFYTFGTRASNSVVGRYSVAEGYNCTASAQCAHAEGGLTEASGMSAHTEGALTKASGSESHAQNHGTEAHANAQTTMGTFNVYDDSAPEPPIHPNGSYGYGTYALIVGNGIDDNNRSNAFTVAWNGDVAASGKVVNGSGDTLTGYKVTRFVPSSTTTGTLSTNADKVWYIDSATVNTAGVTTDGQGTYTIPEAGTWRIKLHCGMYPNTTAKTRLCCGIYMSSITGTRLALGVQQMYNATANSATQVVCVDCEYIGTFSASDKVVIGAFADVTNAKIYRPSGDLTCVTFEKVG